MALNPMSMAVLNFEVQDLMLYQVLSVCSTSRSLNQSSILYSKTNAETGIAASTHAGTSLQKVSVIRNTELQGRIPN